MRSTLPIQNSSKLPEITTSSPNILPTGNCLKLSRGGFQSLTRKFKGCPIEVKGAIIFFFSKTCIFLWQIHNNTFSYFSFIIASFGIKAERFIWPKKGYSKFWGAGLLAGVQRNALCLSSIKFWTSKPKWRYCCIKKPMLAVIWNPRICLRSERRKYLAPWQHSSREPKQSNRFTPISTGYHHV